MNLLYFITGNNLNLHSQCYFSILSFWAQEHIENVYIYTDFPDYYRCLDGKVHIRILTQEQILDWKGPANNYFRVKIKLMEDYCQRQEIAKPFIYLDTDTFLCRPCGDLISGLEAGKAFMHKKEGLLRKMKHSGARMWKQMHDRTFGGIMITQNTCMWNAGLIALPAYRQAEIINQALTICDEINHLGVRHFLVEQCSVSITLNEHFELQPADQWIGHYWAAKDYWARPIADFFFCTFI